MNLSTLQVIIEILRDKLFIDSVEITAQSTLQDDLGLDSLDAVELIMEVEKHYDIQVTDDQAEACNTVQDITVLVDGILEKN